MSEPSDWTRRLWEKLQDITQNEQAWDVLEAGRGEIIAEVVLMVRQVRRVPTTMGLPDDVVKTAAEATCDEILRCLRRQE